MQIENFDSDLLAKTLKSCFSSSETELLARSSKFVQRSTSRLSGIVFLLLNVFDCTNGKESSLNDSCDWLLDEFDIVMTKQSLDGRYNTDAVSFMRQCFSRILSILNKYTLKSISGLPFTRIQLTDATSFKIPGNLSTFYVGHQKESATIKMHFNYNLLNGEVADLLLTDGVSNDNAYKFGEAEKVEANGLYISARRRRSKRTYGGVPGSRKNQDKSSTYHAKGAGGNRTKKTSKAGSQKSET